MLHPNRIAITAKALDPAHRRLLAALNLVRDRFTEAEREYLLPIGLHERFVDLNDLQRMGEVFEAFVETMGRLAARVASKE